MTHRSSPDRWIWLAGAVPTLTGLAVVVWPDPPGGVLYATGMLDEPILAFWSVAEVTGAVLLSLGLIVLAVGSGFWLHRLRRPPGDGPLAWSCVMAGLLLGPAVLAVIIPSATVGVFGPVDWTTIVVGVGAVRAAGIVVLVGAVMIISAALTALVVGSRRPADIVPAAAPS